MPLPTGWSVTSGYAPAIAFSTAPGAGVAITADFGSLWLCRFADDVQDFEEFMAQLFDAPDTAPVHGQAMTTPPSFPTLAGQGWSVAQKADVFDPRRLATSRAARSATRSTKTRSGNSS